jgi:hypothetical protein
MQAVVRIVNGEDWWESKEGNVQNLVPDTTAVSLRALGTPVLKHEAELTGFWRQACLSAERLQGPLQRTSTTVAHR